MIRKLLLLCIGFWLCYMLYGIGVSQFHAKLFETSIQNNRPKASKYHDYKGITHVSSQASKGSGSIEYIATSAKKAGIDFLIVTDTNEFEAEDTEPKVYDDILVIQGGKYSYVDSNLLVYGGLDLHKFKSPGQAQVLLNDLLTQKHRSPEFMSIFLAHPLKKRYEWIGEFPVGLDGIEVINLKELWSHKAEKDSLNFLWSLMLYPFNDQITYFRIIHRPKDTIDLWDKLNESQKTLGILGNHTTAKAMFLPTPKGYAEFPTYETSFKIASNHILLKSELTGDKERDSEKILEAIHRGNFYFSFDLLGDPKGLIIELLDGEGSHLPGESLKFHDGLKLSVSLPHSMIAPFEIQLFKDGKLYTTSNQEETNFNLSGPGVYRVEISVKPKAPFLQSSRWMPWVFSNAFFLH